MTTMSSLAETWDPASAHRDDPHALWALFREAEPISWHPGIGAWLVARPDTATAIAEDPDTWSSVDPVGADVRAIIERAYPTGPAVGEAASATQERLRWAWRHALHPSRVQLMAPTMRAIAARLIADLGGAADLVGEYARPLAADVIAELIGLTGDQAAIAYRDAMDALTWANPLAGRGARIAAAERYAATSDVWRDLHARCVSDPGSDAASILAAVLPYPEWHVQVRTMFGAGVTTPAASIAHTIQCLLEEGSWERAGSDPALVRRVHALQLLREAPHRGRLRTATADTELRTTTTAGEPITVTVRAGERALLLIGPANCDEAAHRCVGEQLARREAQVAVSQLSQSIPGLRVAPDWQPPRPFVHELQALPVMA